MTTNPTYHDIKEAMMSDAAREQSAQREAEFERQGLLLLQAQEQIAALTAERDAAVGLLRRIVADHPDWDESDGNGPGHAHRIVGVWDEDNGDMAGRPCKWCATWRKAVDFLARIDTETACLKPPGRLQS